MENGNSDGSTGSKSKVNRELVQMQKLIFEKMENARDTKSKFSFG